MHIDLFCDAHSDLLHKTFKRCRFHHRPQYLSMTSSSFPVVLVKFKPFPHRFSLSMSRPLPLDAPLGELRTRSSALNSSPISVPVHSLSGSIDDFTSSTYLPRSATENVHSVFIKKFHTRCLFDLMNFGLLNSILMAMKLGAPLNHFSPTYISLTTTR